MTQFTFGCAFNLIQTWSSEYRWNSFFNSFFFRCIYLIYILCKYSGIGFEEKKYVETYFTFSIKCRLINQKQRWWEERARERMAELRESVYSCSICLHLHLLLKIVALLLLIQLPLYVLHIILELCLFCLSCYFCFIVAAFVVVVIVAILPPNWFTYYRSSVSQSAS